MRRDDDVELAELREEPGEVGVAATPTPTSEKGSRTDIVIEMWQSEEHQGVEILRDG